MKKLCLALSCMLFLVYGCGRSSEEKTVEKQIEQQTGGAAKVDLSGKGIKITGESEGEKYTISTGEGAEIPANFPDDVHLYQPSTTLQTAEVSGGHSVSLSTADPVDTVAASYKQQMPGKGWTEQASMTMAGQTILTYEKEGRTASIAIIPMEGATQITVSVATE